MNILLTHPGTQYAYALAAQLHQQGILYRFATGLAFGQDSRLPLPRPLRSRVVAGVPDALLHRMPLLEWKALLQLRLGAGTHATFLKRNRQFQQQIPAALIADSDAVIGFDTSSWLLAQRAHAMGKPFVLDASIAHPLEKEAIYEQLRRQFPAWQAELAPKSKQQIALEQQEMEAADCIVAATQFTRQSHIKHGVDGAKIVVNAYGTDLQFFTSKWAASPADQGLRQIATMDIRQANSPAVSHQDRPLIFVFLGTINARKGIPWLCRVWPQLREKYPQSRLLLGGNGQLPEGFDLPAGVESCGYIAPANRSAFLQQGDVFVFPSYFEGFAQVIIEAMATGLPVITTTATVGPEIISNGREGFVLSPGDDEGLLRSLLHFCQHPQQLETMGRASRQAVLPYTWSAYGDRWKQLLQALFTGR